MPVGRGVGFENKRDKRAADETVRRGGLPGRRRQHTGIESAVRIVLHTGRVCA
jgi:hypothetical protein